MGGRASGAAVLVKREELELLRDLRVAEAQLDRGEGITHEVARRRILDAGESREPSGDQSQ